MNSLGLDRGGLADRIGNLGPHEMPVTRLQQIVDEMRVGNDLANGVAVKRKRADESFRHVDYPQAKEAIAAEPYSLGPVSSSVLTLVTV